MFLDQLNSSELSEKSCECVLIECGVSVGECFFECGVSVGECGMAATHFGHGHGRPHGLTGPTAVTPRARRTPRAEARHARRGLRNVHGVPRRSCMRKPFEKFGSWHALCINAAKMFILFHQCSEVAFGQALRIFSANTMLYEHRFALRYTHLGAYTRLYGWGY